MCVSPYVKIVQRAGTVSECMASWANGSGTRKKALALPGPSGLGKKRVGGNPALTWPLVGQNGPRTNCPTEHRDHVNLEGAM